jgi:D-glycero-D-manno-heptose 1,7-bisphosphate phosphatase
MNPEQPQKTVFLDRDGTLIEEVDFLSRLDDLRLFPFTREAVGLLRSNGYRLIVVTNQSGIGRGLFDEEAMHSIHQQIQKELEGAIDGFYFCPHLPDAGCRCRKPNPGMIEVAKNDFSIDMSRSWVIGDKDLDVELGLNIGLRTVMVETGYGKEQGPTLKREPERIVANLLEAARYITAT